MTSRSCMVVLALAACSRPADPTIGEPDAPIASDGTGSPSPQQWVVGYYVGYQIDAYPIADIAWAALSHIVFAPVTVTADLTLDLTFSDPHDGVRDARTLVPSI
jgi:GH18 family chitinase